MVRFKNRWLIVEFIVLESVGRPSLASRDVWAALKHSVVSHFGDTGWGAVALSLTIKYFSPATNICMIRVARAHLRIAWGALTLLTAVGGMQCVPHVVHVSGTVKHAQLASIAHNHDIVARYRARAQTPAAYHDSFEEYLKTSTEEIVAIQD